MKFRARPLFVRHRRFISMMILVFVFVVGARVSGLFFDINDMIPLAVDQLSDQQGESRVLLITYQEDHFPAPKDLFRLLDSLKSMGAVGFGLTSAPSDLHHELMDYPELVVGVPLASLLELPPELRASAAVNNLPVAGSHHRHLPVLQIENRQFPTLSGTLAGKAGRELKSVDFFIPYKTLGAIPSMGIQQATEGSLIPELVSGRVVLLGRVSSSSGFQVESSVGRMSASMYHAHATDALIRELDIYRLELTMSVVLMLIATVFVAVLMLRYSRWAWAAAGLLTLVMAAISMLSIRYAIQLPLMELVCIVWFGLLLMVRSDQKEQAEALQELIVEYRRKLEARLTNKGFLEQEEHWHQILNLVNQTLDLKRVLFLEREPELHRVKEITSYNCSLNDIEEVRRDYDREPYRTAIATRSPIALTKPYLTELEDDQQYLVALSVGGDVLGFWALSVDQSHAMDERQFLVALSGFADQISELLQMRKSYSGARDAETVAPDYLSSVGLLNNLLSTSDRRLTVFESAFDSQITATVVYDLFGNVIQMNQAMTDVLAQIGFAAYSATALDLLKALTNKDSEACRGLLRFVILNRQRLTVAVDSSLLKDLGLEFLVSLGPINPREDEADSRLMRISGLMIELQDITGVQRATDLKQDIIERLGYRLRGDAESIVLATSLLQEDDLDDETRKEFIEVLLEKVTSATAVIDEVRQHLDSTSVSFMGEACPVDSLDVLKRTLAQIDDAAAKKQLEVDSTFPHVGGLVMADSESLRMLFVAVLQLLIQDAADGSVIRVNVLESEGDQWITMSNEGFGIPRERFLHYIQDETSMAGPEFERIRKGITSVESWGGTFSGDCSVGQGFEFKIRLRAVF